MAVRACVCCVCVHHAACQRAGVLQPAEIHQRAGRPCSSTTPGEGVGVGTWRRGSNQVLPVARPAKQNRERNEKRKERSLEPSPIQSNPIQSEQCGGLPTGLHRGPPWGGSSRECHGRQSGPAPHSATSSSTASASSPRWYLGGARRCFMA